MKEWILPVKEWLASEIMTFSPGANQPNQKESAAV